ncbi:MAG: Dabb family protein [Clostridia bacterium]|nr:Dabb family protein [Clostridia bacterium]
MIEHVVMWKFKDGEGRTREENMAYVRERLLALPDIIPEIKFMQLGRDVSHTEMSYDMMLVTRFESLEALHTYKVHPAHVAVSQYVKKVRTARVVLDAELDENGKLI